MRFLLAASLLALAAPAAAQVPWSANGELTDSDSRGEEERRYDEHRIRLEAGQRYRITVNSEAFDPVARLYRAGEDEPVAENDDAGGGLNSRINYTPEAGGDYVLRVIAFSSEGRGAYAAAAERAAPLPPPISTPGTTVSSSGDWTLWEGELAAGDPDNEGRHFDDYLIRLEAGRRYFVHLEGRDFDALVQLMRPADRESDSPSVIEQDDDAGVGFNALMAFEAAESGEYILRVTVYGSDATGAYRLWLSR